MRFEEGEKKKERDHRKKNNKRIKDIQLNADRMKGVSLDGPCRKSKMPSRNLANFLKWRQRVGTKVRTWTREKGQVSDGHVTWSGQVELGLLCDYDSMNTSGMFVVFLT